jgi:conjugal transfer pilin signal peptidase TrbI
MTNRMTRFWQSARRPLLLSGIVALPYVWAPLAAFSEEHAFLINASPSLPNWAFWLDKSAPIVRGSLIFFEPPASPLLVAHFGPGPHLFGKQVLGLPGDVVSHAGPEVLINGRPVGARLQQTRLGLRLSPGAEGVIPHGCYYVGSRHPRGLDSRYAEVGLACRGHILGSGRAIL